VDPAMLVGDLARELDLPIDCCLTFATFPMEGDWTLADYGVDSTTELEVDILKGPTTVARCAALHSMGHEAHRKVVKADIFGKGKAARSEGTVIGNFVKAAKNGQIDVVQQMIQGGQDINEVCAISCYSAMSSAASNGQDELLNWLIANNGTVNMTNETHYPPIHAAAKAGWHTSVAILVAAKADVDVKEEMLGVTALHVAVDSDMADMVHLLMHSKANADTASKLGITPIQQACSKGAVDCIDLLLDYKCKLRTEDLKGQSPLGAAATKGCAQAVEMMLDAGAVVDASAVFGALSSDCKDCEALLLDAGSSASSASLAGKTALHYAAFSGNHMVISYLLSQNGDIDQRDRNGVTPLMEAARGGRKGSTRVLLTAGADVHLVDAKNNTALHYAGWSEKTKVFEILVNVGGADAEKLNNDGDKPCIEGEKCVVM